MQYSRTSLLAFTAFAAFACSGDPQAPVQDCPPDTGSVDVTVTVGETVTFNWTPTCALALLLVELAASDQWAAESPGLESGDPALANRIFPPVTYGVVPSGAIESQAPAQLIPGEKYDVALWRVLPAGSTVPCVLRLEEGCLLAVGEFVR